jgi:hypothetical protein
VNGDVEREFPAVLEGGTIKCDRQRAEAARSAGFRAAVIKSCGREILGAVADFRPTSSSASETR